MWSNLRKLWADRLGSRRKHRGLPLRFRGQFEPLESRTVLSATIGVMAFDADANTITVAVWQIPSDPSASPPRAPVGDALVHAYGSTNTAWHPGGGERIFRHDTTGTVGDVRIDASGFVERPPVLATAPQDDKPTVRAQAPAAADPNTGALNLPVDLGGAGGFVNSALTQTRYEQTLPSGALTDAAAFAALSTPISSLSARSTLVTTDAAFDKYTTSSLLLAAADGLDSPDDKFGDADSLEDERSTNDATDSFAAEEVAASLDALQRERMALDAVLAKLHDVTLKENERPSSTAAHEQHHRDPRTAAIEFFAGKERTAHQQESRPADGGMVLLQPTGDPNSSAYDLADVFFARLGGDDHAPLAVEASLGMYQAIDVGEQPAANRAQPPIAQPAQSVRPSVSAENAPAKKSEQPT